MLTPSPVTIQQTRKYPVPRRRGRKSAFGRLVALCIMAGVLLTYVSAYMGVLRLRTQVARVHKDVAAWQVRNKDLQRRLRYLKSDEYVESVARRDLGLVKKGEVLVVVESGSRGKSQ